MALAMRRVTCTMIGLKQLGIMWLQIMVRLVAPMARAASTNSTSRTVITAPRTTRAKIGTEEAASAKARLRVLAPRAATITMANNVMGIASKMSVIRMITLSTFPP